MTITPAGLSAVLQTELGSVADVIDSAKFEDFCDALGAAIVNYLKDNAVVVMANGGVDSNGDSLSTNEGEIT